MGNEKFEIRESSATLFPLGNRNKGVNMAKVKLQTVAEIGALIRTTRKKQRVSQAVLAGLASVGTRFISDLENGKGTVQVQKLLDVLNALGLGLYIVNRWEND
jgi:HTH-type transcriptional regulator/antitoxin HipB